MREKRLAKNLEMLKEEIMKILIVGAGGREHAIAWKLSQNKKVEKILNNHYNKSFPMERYKGYAGVLQQYMFFYEREMSNVKLK